MAYNPLILVYLSALLKGIHTKCFLSELTQFHLIAVNPSCQGKPEVPSKSICVAKCEEDTPNDRFFVINCEEDNFKSVNGEGLADCRLRYSKMPIIEYLFPEAECNLDKLKKDLEKDFTILYESCPSTNKYVASETECLLDCKNKKFITNGYAKCVDGEWEIEIEKCNDPSLNKRGVRAIMADEEIIFRCAEKSQDLWDMKVTCKNGVITYTKEIRERIPICRIKEKDVCDFKDTEIRFEGARRGIRSFLKDCSFIGDNNECVL